MTYSYKNLSNVDFGFRFFKVDSSNMKYVYYNSKKIGQGILANFKDNIKEEQTAEYDCEGNLI